MTFCLLHVQGVVGLGVEVITEAFFVPFSHLLLVAAQSTDILLAFGGNTVLAAAGPRAPTWPPAAARTSDISTVSGGSIGHEHSHGFWS